MKRRMLIVCNFLSLMACVALGNVVLIGNNVTLSFDDIEANFGEFQLALNCAQNLDFALFESLIHCLDEFY